MAGFLSLALAATLAVVLVEYGVTGTCHDNMGAKGPLMKVFHGKARELSRCLKEYRPECGRTLKGKTCSQLRDHFQSFLADLKQCVEGAPPTTTTTTTTTTTPTTTPLPPPRDCKDVYDRGNTGDLVTDIFPDGVNAKSTRCINGATVFINRGSKAGDYDGTFAEYENGFGELSGNYYLGNKALFDLTSRGDYKLVVDLNFTNGVVRQAVYDTFKLAGPDDFYRLTVGGFSGNAENAMALSNGQPFSTKDKKLNSTFDTALSIYHGGFWWDAAATENNALVTVTEDGNTFSVFSWGISTTNYLASCTFSLVRTSG